MSIIKALRLKSNLSQSELANKIGVEQNTVSQWENEKRKPSLENVVKLSNLFNCTVDELLKGGEVS